ncbi:MAG: response regulator [Treponema sp.]|nr:response regulator [Treponema sp.]
MKTALIIEEVPSFREYLKTKLEDNNIEAILAINGLDGITKLRNTIPDLLIIDYNLNRQGCMEILKQKRASAGLAPIPVIVTAQQLDQKKILELVPYNVKKVFSKPIKIDALFTTTQELLGVTFAIDTSPGIVEVHVNEDIIFVEITEGLNRDKLDLLRYKITELMELYQIRVPKVIIMISGFSLKPSDAPNLVKLLNNVLRASQAAQRNIRILTKDDFLKNFIKEQKEYKDIEVVSKLQYALDGLLKELNKVENGEKQAVLMGDKVLSAGESKGESIQLRFDGEVRFSLEEVKESLHGLSIAAVDDDETIRELIKHTFSGFDIDLSFFPDGAEFTESLDNAKYDLILLDIVMPRADGFAVLRELSYRNINVPVIILSAVSQRDTVIRAFQMGIKSYLTKPLKPAEIFKKALEILKVNF